MLVVRQNKKDQFKIYHIDDSKSVWNQKKNLANLKQNITRSHLEPFFLNYKISFMITYVFFLQHECRCD